MIGRQFGGTLDADYLKYDIKKVSNWLKDRLKRRRKDALVETETRNKTKSNNRPQLALQ